MCGHGRYRKEIVMSDPTFRLPARPSLEQLRKQAKELLRDYRKGDAAAVERFRAITTRLADPARSDNVTLADAQFIFAREHGFESWVKLVRHLEDVHSSGRLEQYEKLALDFVAAYEGDAEALQRLNDLFPRTLTVDQLRDLFQQRLSALSGSAVGSREFALVDAQLFVARQHGFDSWARFVESLVQPASDPHSAPIGMSSTPPFYKIDWKNNIIEPRLVLSDNDWQAIFDVMDEHEITGLNANGQMTDSAMERLPELDHITRLYMGGTKRLTDKGLKQLARMPQLQELDLSEYPGGRITDRGLESLRSLPELKRFQMCWQSGISDAGIANLAFCENLESVDLLGTPTGDGAIKALTGKRKLRRFKSGRLVTDAGLPLLQQFPVFKTWHTGDISYSLMSP